MTELVSSILGIVADHRVWAYALAYLLAAAEALPVVGTIVPGSIIIVGLGALVPAGSLEVVPLLIWSTLGAMTGDGSSYLLGRIFQRDIVGTWLFRRYPTLFERSEALFRARGQMAVFGSRFVQGLRAFVPMAAGIVGMPAGRFFAVNLLSAVVWAPAHVFAGALLGGSILVTAAIAGRLALLLVLALVIVAAGVWLSRRMLRWAPRVWGRVQSRAMAWASRGQSLAHREVAAIFDPERGEGWALGLFAVILAGALWLLVGVLEDVVTGDPLVRADAAVYHFLQGLRTPWTDRLFVIVTELGDRFVVTAVALAVLAWLALRRAWRTAVYWVAGLVLASGFTTVLKLALHRPRPIAVFDGFSAYAFPSGHAAMSMVMLGFLSILIARELHSRWWPWVFGPSIAIVSLIAFSRLYLGAHWLSDVIGGLAFGTVWVALLGIAYLRHGPQVVRGRRLYVVAAAAFVLAGVWHVRTNVAADLRLYAAASSAPAVLSVDDWQGSAWRELPARRADLEGGMEEPLTLQWAGELDELKGALLRGGWRSPAPWSAANLFAWLSPDPLAGALPVLPKLHNGRGATLTLIQTADRLPGGAVRLVLRLWDSGTRVADPSGAQRPLWIGEAVAEAMASPMGLFSATRTLPDFNQPVAAVTRSLAASALMLRQRAATTEGWNGQVALIDAD